MGKTLRYFLIFTSIALVPATAQNVVRLQEIAHVNGIQDNDLFGVGIVVGLTGTGDSNAATRARLANFLHHNKINVSAGDLAAGNIALVSVSAALPPFIRAGEKIPVTVSSIQDATSLAGGELLFTTLKGIDGKVYAIARGALCLGGYAVRAGGNKAVKNHLTVAHIPGGGRIEQTIPTRLVTETGHLELRLANRSLETARNVARTIDAFSKSDLVHPLGKVEPVDGGLVRIALTDRYLDNGPLVDLLARIYGLPVQVGGRSRIVINERTGTIVIGEHVRIGRCALAKGNLTVLVTEDSLVSQPNPLSNGTTQEVKRRTIEVEEGRIPFSIIPGGASLTDVVEILNSMGATPRDIIDILKNLDAAGVLHAELVTL